MTDLIHVKETNGRESVDARGEFRDLASRA